MTLDAEAAAGVRPAADTAAPHAARRGARVADACFDTCLLPGGADAVTVVVSGELDLACAHELACVLCEALDETPAGLRVDLAEVTFCDCAGVRALLVGHAYALQRGRRFTVGPTSAGMARILALTDAGQRLSVPTDRPLPQRPA